MDKISQTEIYLRNEYSAYIGSVGYLNAVPIDRWVSLSQPYLVRKEWEAIRKKQKSKK